MKSRFCPKCGTNSAQFIKGFCKECYLADHKIIEIPVEIEIEQCKKCEKIKLKGKWVEKSDSAIGGFIEDKVKIKELMDAEVYVELMPLEEGKTEARIRVKGILDSVPIITEKGVLVKPKIVVCDPCMKMSSDYFEATVQLRYKENPDESEFSKKHLEIERILHKPRKTDSLAAIVSSAAVTKGFDFKVGSKRAGRIVAERFARQNNTSVITSSKLVGVDKRGKNKYRFTFCVRVKD